jgi:RimJ/RimL family protein N-acetyltransferase
MRSFWRARAGCCCSPPEVLASRLLAEDERSLWGQGLGTEATRMMLDYGFGTLNLNRIWLQVFASHVGAQRVYEKAGFRKEGVQRQQHFLEGRYEDGVLMGILRSEWTPLGHEPAPTQG